MSYTQKDGQGSLFKNERKEKDSHPDYKGSITVGGAKLWLSAWLKDGKKGKWMSLAAQPAEDAGKFKRTLASHEPGTVEDDIPF